MSSDSSYTQDFNTLASTGTANAWADNSTLPNWFWQRTGTGTTYDANNGGSTTGAAYSYGTTSASDRAMGSLGSGNTAAGSFAWGVLLQNTSGSTMTDLRVSYTGEQWRNSAAAAQAATFWYQVSSSPLNALNPGSNTGWTSVSSLDFTSPVTGGTAGALDGNAAGNRVSFTNVAIPGLSLAPGDYIMLRWSDPDHSGTDHGLSIDDVTLAWSVPVAPPTYTITASAGTNGTITPSGAVTVVQGSDTSFTITPDPGYSVDSLIVDDVLVDSTTSYTFTNVQADHTIRAVFAVSQYTITASAGPNGQISPTGPTTVSYGGTQVFTITPDPGYSVDSLIVDDVLVDSTTSYTFTNVQADHTIRAVFAVNQYTITASAGPNGQISPTGPTTVSYGGTQVFTITPDPGYSVDSLIVDDVLVDSTTSYTFVNVAADHTIRAVFTPSGYVITASAFGPGTISPSGAVTVPAGANQSFTIAPDTGAHVDSVLVDGVNQGPVTSYDFVNVLANASITAYFSLDVYTITASAGSNGQISPAGPTPVLYGGTQVFTITPDPGYSVDSLLVDDVLVDSTTSYTFVNVAADHTIRAVFSINVYTITATAGPNGSISPAGAVPVVYGSDTSFTATPDSGYLVASLVVDGVDQGPLTSYAFTAVDTNHTIHAVFAPEGYVITASASGPGTIAPSGPVVVPSGGGQSFTIVPDTGAHIDSVLVDGVNQGPVTSYDFVNVLANASITAYFSLDVYTITASAGPNGQISPTGPTTVAYGGTQAFTITPDPGYSVDSLLVDDVLVDSTTSYTFVNVAADHTIRAVFSINVYTITASAVGNGAIAPSGAVTIPYGADTTFVMTPAANHHIDSVVVDGVNAGALPSYTFTAVDADHVITAYFSIDTYMIVAAAVGGGNIAPADSVVVPYGADQTFTITPDTGYHVDSVLVDGVNQGPLLTYTFPAVSADHAITAYFSINYYTIVPAVVGNGTIAPSDTVIIAHGTDTTFTVTPAVGYHVDSLLVNGVNLGPLTAYTFTAVSGNGTITAYISLDYFTVTATATSGGTISPSGVIPVGYGADLSFTITPALGRHIDSVLVDGVNQGAITSYTFLNITSNRTISAYFSIDLFTIVATAGSNGTINPSGTVIVPYGSDRTFTFNPAEGYDVDSVFVDTLALGPLPSYTFTNVTTNHTIAVTFRRVNKFLSLTPDSIIAPDPATAKPYKPARRGRDLKPNWMNLISEAVYQGAFQPGATESDDAGGMIVGLSSMVQVGVRKWKPVKAVADSMAWVRLTKWDFRKNMGKSYTAFVKTLLDRSGTHDGDPRGFDYKGYSSDAGGRPLVKQQILLPPRKHNNILYAEMVALKLNIAASQLGKTPVGFGELIFEEDGHLCDGRQIVEISAMADTALTRWWDVDESIYSGLYDAVSRINAAFTGPLDTVRFEDGGQLVLRGAVNVEDVPFLRLDTSITARRLVRTTDATDGEEDFDDPDFDEEGPVAAKLYQNYPNPFNPSTTIAFRLREPSLVTLTVYNLLGQPVATLVQGEELEAGYQTVEFAPSGLASGVYFYRIDIQELDGEALHSVVTNKMLLLK